MPDTPTASTPILDKFLNLTKSLWVSKEKVRNYEAWLHEAVGEENYKAFDKILADMKKGKINIERFFAKMKNSIFVNASTPDMLEHLIVSGANIFEEIKSRNITNAFTPNPALIAYIIDKTIVKEPEGNTEKRVSKISGHILHTLLFTPSEIMEGTEIEQKLYLDNIRKLLALDPGAANRRFDTREPPLYLATSWGWIEPVKILLHYGADPHMPNDYIGRDWREPETTSMVSAVCFNKHEIIDILLQHAQTLEELDKFDAEIKATPKEEDNQGNPENLKTNKQSLAAYMEKSNLRREELTLYRDLTQQIPLALPVPISPQEGVSTTGNLEVLPIKKRNKQKI